MRALSPLRGGVVAFCAVALSTACGGEPAPVVATPPLTTPADQSAILLQNHDSLLAQASSEPPTASAESDHARIVRMRRLCPTATDVA